MINSNEICWVYNKVFPERLCKDILHIAKQKRLNTGLIGNGLNAKENKEYRDSKINWLNDRWIFRLIDPFIKDANEKAGWNFQYNFTESLQFTSYQKNQFYNWHTDSSFHKNDKFRKISAVISLNSKKEYKGGELQFMNNDISRKLYKCKEMENIGSIAVFPSFIFHRVTKILSGTRYSLVVWNNGERFK
jgi:PKHD-type hydroxylase